MKCEYPAGCERVGRAVCLELVPEEVGDTPLRMWVGVCEVHWPELMRALPEILGEGMEVVDECENCAGGRDA